MVELTLLGTYEFVMKSLITHPLRKARNWFRAQGIPTKYNDIKILSLKDRHKGERCVLVGMGPSLRMEDLERLKNCVTFGCNQVFKAFAETTWRPTYYTVSDCVVAETYKEEILAVDSIKIFPDYSKEFLGSERDVLWLHKCPAKNGEDSTKLEFSKNLVEGVAAGGATVIYDQLQIAYYMGFREAILVGIDFNYENFALLDEHSQQGQLAENKNEGNHFIKNYYKPGEKMNVPKVELQRNAFQKASQVYAESGRKLINASRKTKLDVIERGDFDALFPSTATDASE
jgi:hypothetical protein